MLEVKEACVFLCINDAVIAIFFYSIFLLNHLLIYIIELEILCACLRILFYECVCVLLGVVILKVSGDLAIGALVCV